LNLDKVFETPHTREQVAALWNARHASKPRCLSAVIQADRYQNLMDVAKSYPSFVLPLPREQPGEPTPSGGGGASRRPYEFYFLEWSLYERPPDPRDVPQFPFYKRPDASSNRPSNPPKSVLLFTPLGEYKLYNSYATAHLTLTNYTDLVQSHGIVLMRGEITPSENDPGKLRMKSIDAQLLALAMQKFYLEGGSECGREVLAKFHEKPEEFRWEEVIQICDFKGAT
jgi:ATP synthase F1 complex assembly factor 1